MGSVYKVYTRVKNAQGDYDTVLPATIDDMVYCEDEDTDLATWKRSVMAVSGVTTGSGSAYALAAPEGFTLADGTPAKIKLHTPSLTNPTLNIGGTGAKPIKTISGSSLRSGIAAGTWITVIYSQSADAYILLGNGGDAEYADKLKTPRTFNVNINSGNFVGTAQSFDGSGNITIPVTISEATTSKQGLMSASDKVKLSNLDGYGVCNSASSTVGKTATLDGFVLRTGAVVGIVFTNGNTATAPSLNVNGTGAKSIYFNGTNIKPSMITTGMLAFLQYNGSQWVLLNPAVVSRSSGQVVIGNSASGDVAGITCDAVYTTATDLQNRINAVADAGGGCVYLNAGTYTLNGIISIPAGIELRGAGPLATVLTFSSSSYYVQLGTEASNGEDTPGGIIRDLQIKYTSTSSSMLLHLVCAKNLRVENVYFIGNNSPIYPTKAVSNEGNTRASSVLFSNCTFLRCHYGFYGESYSQASDMFIFDNCRFYGSGTSNYSIAIRTPCAIVNNCFISNYYYGVHNAYGSSAGTNITFTNSYMSNGYYGLYVSTDGSSSNRVKMTGCTLLCSYGYYLYDANSSRTQYALIRDNIMASNNYTSGWSVLGYSYNNLSYTGGSGF